MAPSDGEFTFFSACDDSCDVYMSPDEGKDHIRRIISQRRWSGHNQWDKYVNVLIFLYVLIYPYIHISIYPYINLYAVVGFSNACNEISGGNM